ncbi:protein MgtR [Salmonella enterica]|nr:protein MgtR [Salmonella enterica]EIT5538473.1 protein MgtR [Salmonella enterica]EIY5601795.1 protein MgtR [Salmonella enterica]EJN0147846.1 protein MgtR [Salmonella enterica]EJN0244747.1 protein MgtR [Salmonella enterica]
MRCAQMNRSPDKIIALIFLLRSRCR